MTLTVATYNVHGFVGLDGRFDPLRVAGVVRGLGASVVALQEALSSWGGGAGDTLRGLAREELQMELLEGPTLHRRGARYGNALLCSLPLLRVERIDLGSEGREPRGALLACFATAAGPLRVVATHLGLQRRERALQVARLEHRLRTFLRGDGACVLLGDFNDWTPGARQLAPLRRLCGPFSGLRTFPTRRPALALDRIAVSPREWVRRIEAVRTPASCVASDHLPLRAELALPADRAARPPAGRSAAARAGATCP